MNRSLSLVLSDLHEEAGWTRNDLDVLERVAWFLDEMRGHDVPGDLFIRIRGGFAWQQPWAIDVYAEASAVHSTHQDDLHGFRQAVTERRELQFTLMPIRDPQTQEAEQTGVS